MEKRKSDPTEETAVQSTEGEGPKPNPGLVVGSAPVSAEAEPEPTLQTVEPPSADLSVAVTSGSPSEEIAQVAYAKFAEEMKWKGDFPAWEAISDRARAAYIEGAEHIRGLVASAEAAEQLINHELQAEGAEDTVARVTPKARTHFEEFVLKVLQA